MAITTFARPAHLTDRRIGLIYDLRKLGPRVRARRTEPQGNLDHLIQQAQDAGAPWWRFCTAAASPTPTTTTP